jgi:TonB family protein
MHAPRTLTHGELFKLADIAKAAGVRTYTIERLADREGILTFRRLFTTEDAVRLVRLARGREASRGKRSPITLLSDRGREGGAWLLTSGLLHAIAFLLLLVGASLGLFDATYSDDTVRDLQPIKLVYLMEPGPGGGGGGGGLEIPKPPPVAQKKAPVPRKISNPIPPVRHDPPPPPRIAVPPPITPHVPPMVVEAPKPPAVPAVQAPVAPIASDPVDQVGKLTPTAAVTTASNGPGTGGGVGTGRGSGIGEGDGGGIGPGSGGGTGGGPFRPGSGIDPPVLLREVKALYTEEARRQSVEGDVVLEIVVRHDGSVGDVRVSHALGAGLDQKAVDAVRQWRFGPAKRQGSPVDVVVEVSVEFKLR